jgi:hypothetical protein
MILLTLLSFSLQLYLSKPTTLNLIVQCTTHTFLVWCVVMGTSSTDQPMLSVISNYYNLLFSQSYMQSHDLTCANSPVIPLAAYQHQSDYFTKRSPLHTNISLPSCLQGSKRNENKWQQNLASQWHHICKMAALLTLVLSSIRLRRNLPSRSSMCQLSCTRSGFSSIPSRRSSMKEIHISLAQVIIIWTYFVLNIHWQNKTNVDCCRKCFG